MLKDRTGEKRIMNCGLTAEIIAYRTAHDLDVRFSDGVVVCNKSYKSFKNGTIGHPGICTVIARDAAERIGEEKIMSSGQTAVITEYLGASDVTVKFEDGYVARHRSYDAFANGSLTNPNCRPGCKKDSRMGESREMNNGQLATITGYRNAGDIDVTFEDGTIVSHTGYDYFSKGSISNPNFDPKAASCIGMTNTMHSGDKAEIIAYRSNRDIDIRFESGVVRKHTTMQLFKEGRIRTPRNAVGESRTMSNGQIATVIANDEPAFVDVQFEDGTVVKHRRYTDFAVGKIGNPNLKATEREGMTAVNKQGRKAVLTKYMDSRHVAIQFEDGTKLENVSFYSFLRGEFAHPSDSLAEKRIGEENTNSQGFKMTIIDYRKANDIDVIFADGKVRRHALYKAFRSGSLRYPESHRFAGFDILLAWKDETAVYYNCRCKSCGYEDILTPDQMIKHMQDCKEKQPSA